MEDEGLKKWNEKFNECLSLEFSNSAYFRVHHILVMAFMLQTGRYADSYKKEALSLLKEFLASPLTPPTKSRIAEINSNLSSDKRYDNIFNKEMGDIIDIKETIANIIH